MKNLEVLNLSENKIRNIPNEIENLKRLESINLAGKFFYSLNNLFMLKINPLNITKANEIAEEEWKKKESVLLRLPFLLDVINRDTHVLYGDLFFSLIAYLSILKTLSP